MDKPTNPSVNSFPEDSLDGGMPDQLSTEANPEAQSVSSTAQDGDRTHLRNEPSGNRPHESQSSSLKLAPRQLQQSAESPEQSSNGNDDNENEENKDGYTCATGILDLQSTTVTGRTEDFLSSVHEQAGHEPLCNKTSKVVKGTKFDSADCTKNSIPSDGQAARDFPSQPNSDTLHSATGMGEDLLSCEHSSSYHLHKNNPQCLQDVGDNFRHPSTSRRDHVQESSNTGTLTSELCVGRRVDPMNLYLFSSQRTDRQTVVIPASPRADHATYQNSTLNYAIEVDVPSLLNGIRPMMQGTGNPSENTCTVDLLTVIFVQMILNPELLHLFRQSGNAIFSMHMPNLFHLFLNGDEEGIRRFMKTLLPHDLCPGHDFYGNDQQIICYLFEKNFHPIWIRGTETPLLLSSTLKIWLPERRRLCVQVLEQLVVDACALQAETERQQLYGRFAYQDEPPPMVIVRLLDEPAIDWKTAWVLGGRIRIGPFSYMVGGYSVWHNQHYTARLYFYGHDNQRVQIFNFDNNEGFTCDISPEGYISMIFLFRDPRV